MIYGIDPRMHCDSINQCSFFYVFLFLIFALFIDILLFLFAHFRSETLVNIVLEANTNVMLTQLIKVK